MKALSDTEPVLRESALVVVREQALAEKVSTEGDEEPDAGARKNPYDLGGWAERAADMILAYEGHDYATLEELIAKFRGTATMKRIMKKAMVMMVSIGGSRGTTGLARSSGSAGHVATNRTTGMSTTKRKKPKTRWSRICLQVGRAPRPRRT